MSALSLYDKLWNAHVVHVEPNGMTLLYIDRQLVHEVTSPQAFEGLVLTGRSPHRVGSILATPDHNVPTTHRADGIVDPVSRLQVETLDNNCQTFGLTEFRMDDRRQGIVHVIGPEQGFTQPGVTLVCGDSHTSTHGAFAALAFGIGTSEVEHVMATQCLWQQKSKAMRVSVEGDLVDGVTAKDIALAIIGRIGTAGGTGYAIEFAGSAIRALSMEGRMTLCTMAIEAGARAGLVAADEKTVEYLRGRTYAPSGAEWDRAAAYWRSWVSDADAVFDAEVRLDAADIAPQVTWGTSPEMVVAVTGRVPNPADAVSPVQKNDWERALAYMGLTAGTPIAEIAVDIVFIGSCTNSRIEAWREAAAVAWGRKKAVSVKQVLVVPGSGLVKAQDEAEGLDKICIEAGI